MNQKRGPGLKDKSKEFVGYFLKRKDLEKPSTLKPVFNDIRNYLAGMTKGMTRDEALAQEVINLLFCKVYDEINTPPNEEVSVQVKMGESPEETMKRIEDLFNKKIKTIYATIFDPSIYIKLDSKSLCYFVSKIQKYCITNAERDVITEAFEVFIGPALRGGEGQFFTPRNAVRMMVAILDPTFGEYTIDPACGFIGFLVATLEYVWEKLELEAKEKKWSEEILATKKREEAEKYLAGIDKDSFLVKVAKAYSAILGGAIDIFCENSLEQPYNWDVVVQQRIPLESSDVLMTNPPHGSKIQIKGETMLSQYALARIWRENKRSKDWEITKAIREKQPPQILFIERCLQFLKPGGRMGIIIPESLVGNPTYGYVPTFLRKKTKILGVVSMPEELFQPCTHNKTCVLFLEKTMPEEDYPIFMGIVKWCGHDSRGNWVPYDDMPKITQDFLRFKKDPINFPRSPLSFATKLSEIKFNILIPKYYDPSISEELESLKRTQALLSVGQLVREKVLSISTGVEVGKLSYGTGPVPFVRTSDISNWEIKIDPKHRVAEEIYMKYQKKAGVKEHDILMVRDGTYLVGTTCMITQYDTKILFQSHIYRLRVLKPDILSPFLLFSILNSPIVKKQIDSRRFTQNIIDTLGSRILEIILPIPKDGTLKEKMINETKQIIEGRARLRQKAKLISEGVT